MVVQKVKGFIAWLDILGFKSITKRNPRFSGNIGLLIQQLEYSIVHGKRVPGKTPDGSDCIFPDVTQKFVKAFIMSDTFIIYTQTDTKNDLRNLLFTIWWLMPNGYAAIDEDLALRGAITKGDIEIISDQTALIDNCIITQGPAVILAVEIESTLAAGVCMIDESILDGIDLNEFQVQIQNRNGIFNPVIKWQIPRIISNDTIEITSSYVINWPKSPVSISSLTNKFQRMIDQASQGKPLKLAKNTKEFYDSVTLNRCPSYEV